MSVKSQKRSRESLGPASASGPESIHYNPEGIAIDKENNTEGNLTPPSKRVRSDGHARNDTKMGEGAMDMELDYDRDAATGSSKSGTDTAEASQLPRKRSRKAKGDTAVTPASSTSTGASTAAPPPSAKEHNQMSQICQSAAAVEAAPLIPSGSVPKGGQKGVRVMKKPPVAPAAHSERDRHSTSRSGAKANAGSESSLVNGSKGKGKARATKARCVPDAGVTSASQTLSAPAFGGTAEAESPVRGVSPSRFRRIAGSTDDLPNDNDLGRGSGKSGPRSSALKDDGRRGAIGNKEASAETFWADCLLSKVLPAVDDCSAMEVLKNMVLKGVLVISLLLGSWAIWTFATYSVSRVLKGGVSYNEGGIQEGVSRRSIALSLVHETEEYQSLTEVLESRRRELVDVRAVDEALPANLESLREGAKALARSMQVLREQAKSIIGPPQHPDAMVVITRSRLTEVDAMVWTLKEASHATSGIIAAGQKWVDDAERNLEKDKWQLQRTADADWEKKVEPILTSAYLEVERVAAAADVLREHMMRKTSIEDVDGYIKRVESYRATTTTTTRRRDAPDVQQRVEAVIAREVGMEQSIYGEYVKETSEALGLPLLTNVDEMKHLVAREMEISSSGGTGMRDYASLAGGASVVHSNGLTSPSMISEGDGWWGYGAKIFGTRKYKSLRSAEEALSTSNVPGRCFAFKGGRGKLTVKLGKPYTTRSPKGGILPGFVRVTHVSIEHAAVANVPSAALSAPRVFVVLGWDADPAASSTFLRPHVLISRAEFSVEHNAPTVQMFEVFSGGSPPPPVGWITLEVESNHGGEWTCLYGFRVHGEFIPSKDLSKAP